MQKTKINLTVILASLSVIVLPAFALELNSGNIASLGCATTDKQCDLTNTSITTIASGTFSLYTGLRALDLSGNTISDISSGVFSVLTELSYLGLANNELVFLNTGSFAGLNSLSTLDLSNNKIIDIRTAMFSGLNSLSTLYIGGNPLSSVESGFANALSGVKLLLQAPKGSNPVVSSSGTELDTAFAFAKKYELTYAASLDAFAPEKSITRRALAKMLALYMKNYKEVNPDTVSACGKFTDISGETPEDQDYIKQACEYKLMGRNADGKTVSKKFNPSKEVTRAHFATILSRILWGDTYNSTDTTRYYEGHINALKDKGILSNTDPKIVEPRGFIVLMLSRAE